MPRERIWLRKVEPADVPRNFVAERREPPLAANSQQHCQHPIQCFVDHCIEDEPAQTHQRLAARPEFGTRVDCPRVLIDA